eukprot:CAMPEP_0115159520 /NCGR_PEP_ID=MMETSP0227-20121206/70251_1 /TAXON_ID=89957 /ORGANISM="Polarella glacialis, Strain CCMP 1383" /LENGTH=628 /DNA_ID=CAMNT_0002571227 /DNA_START=54 /DNA_END=1941 /DNA_ORIENTATION=-
MALGSWRGGQRRVGRHWLLPVCVLVLLGPTAWEAARAFLPPPSGLHGPQAVTTSTGAKLAEVVASGLPEAAHKAPLEAAQDAEPSRVGLGGMRTSGLTMMLALPALKAAQTAVKGASRLASGRSGSASALARQAGSDSMQQEDVGGEMTKVVIPVLAGFAGWIALMYAIQHSMLTLPFLAAGQELYFPIIATFIAGYGLIILEEQTEINKAATALVLGVLIWAFVGTGLGLSPSEFQTDIKATLEDVSEVVFFLLGALTIVEIMDAHKGFDIITKSIQATKSRDLLVVIGLLTFALSSVLNNLTVVIVMVALLQKVVKDEEFRMRLGGLVVVASNAGGAWTPIGDITTTMLYIGGQVTTVPLLCNLAFPSVLCVLGAIGFEYIKMDGEQTFERPASSGEEDEKPPEGQQLVFWGGLSGMVLVPVFTNVTQCPAWSGMMLVLGMLGIITSLLHEPNDKRYSLKGALTRVEIPDTLFFLGVLFAVGGLERIGLLKAFAIQLSSVVPTDSIVAILLGFASAIVDNVPLVAATQGMYDLTAHPANDPLWNLITYCSATGGSLLVIGSAAGVAFMGMEKNVSFGWYFSTIGPAALVGYFCGVGGILAQQALGLSVAELSESDLRALEEPPSAI